MKITIIGCGYVGSAIAKRLKDEGHEVTVTTRCEKKRPFLQDFSHHVSILHGNDSQALKCLLQNQDVVILSLAADSADAYEKTYLDTAKALSLIVDSCPNLSQVIYTGSTSVYGDHKGESVNEETPTSSTHVTAKILIETEETLLRLSSKKRSVCIFRLGEIYGPDREIASRLRNLNGRSVPGNGNSITNLILLTDIVKAVEFALNKSLNGIYNLCGDIHTTRRNLYDQICSQEKIPNVTWDPTKTSLHSGNKLVLNDKIKAAGFSFSGA